MDLGIRHGGSPRWFHRLPRDEQVDVLAWATHRGEVTIGGKAKRRKGTRAAQKIVKQGIGSTEAKAFWGKVMA